MQEAQDIHLAILPPTSDRKPGCSVDLEIWGDLAHLAAENLMQGDHIQVIGKLKKNNWTKRDGTEMRDVSISLTKINRIINQLPQQEYVGDTAVSQLLLKYWIVKNTENTQ